LTAASASTISSRPATVTTFSVVTVTHNSGDVVLEMVAALPEAAELVLVDNASSDGVAGRVRALRPSAVVLELSTNDGFGAGCNVGARAASGEVVIFLNPDCRPRPGALEALARAAAESPGSVFGPTLLDADGVLRHQLRRRSRPSHEILELMPSWRRWAPDRARRDLPAHDPRYSDGGDVAYLQGACLAVDRDRFLAVGGFDEDFFLYSEEETLCETLVRAGGRCVYLPQAVVEHVGATSTEGVSAFALRHAYRSRAIFYRKRYGEIIGSLAILGIAVAAVISAALRPLAVALGRQAAAEPATEADTLRGLLAGATTRIHRR
jgi:N-acetylglucosaminyl-diphospho-decaprenol L-rhamnosyltransferase